MPDPPVTTVGAVTVKVAPGAKVVEALAQVAEDPAADTSSVPATYEIK